MLQRGILRFFNRFVHNQSEVPQVTHSLQVVEIPKPPEDDSLDFKEEKQSVLNECQEDISHVAPYLKPSFNFAAYVNKSESLRQLVNLGVDLSKLEKNPEVPPFLLKLDFEKDMKNHVIFLSEIGVSVEDLPNFITKNPFIFREDLNNLEVRINYLKSKKFTNEMIARIITKNPIWLMFQTQEIDRRLGWFQKQYSLTGNEVRQLATQKPKIITYSLHHVKLNTFSIVEEMGFNKEQAKIMLLKKPDLFTKRHENVLKTFEFIHKNMDIPTERIIEFPDVLTFRKFRVEQRYLFLKNLRRDQFNPKEPNYVSLSSLVCGSDAEFCKDVAKSSVQAYNMFLKTL